jgi:hypothetical protein
MFASVSTSRGGAARRARSAEVAEQVAQILGVDVAERAAARAAAPAERVAAGEAARPAGRAEAVVLLALGLVAEHVVGALDFLEAGLGLLVAGVAVGVVLPGQLAVGLLDIGFGGVAGNAEGFVQVAGHASLHPERELHPILGRGERGA